MHKEARHTQHKVAISQPDPLQASESVLPGDILRVCPVLPSPRIPVRSVRALTTIFAPTRELQAPNLFPTFPVRVPIFRIGEKTGNLG